MKTKTYKFECKGVVSDIDDFYTMTGIASDNSIDKANDIVSEGAIVNSVLKFGMPKFVLQHDIRNPIGIINDIKQVGNETHIEVKLPKGFPDIDKMIALVKMGAYGGFSIGFNSIEKEMEGDIRKFNEIEVVEISLVTIPCNSNAVITSAKSLYKDDIEQCASIKDVESILKEKFSNNESKLLISKIKSLSKPVRDEQEPVVVEKTRDELDVVKKCLEEFLQEIKSK